jgi:hypothetical protein
MRTRIVLISAPIIVALGVMVLFYYLPNLIELRLLGRFGPFATCVLFGDSLGCAAICLVYTPRWQLGLGLYAVLGVIDTILLETHLLSPHALIWFTDLVPSLALAAIIGTAVFLGLLERGDQLWGH